MYCLDCGNKLKEINYIENCTKYVCSTCDAYWFQTRTVIVEWKKQYKPLDSNNGGINAPRTFIDKKL